MSAPITLPGTIPGLLRRGSPVVVGKRHGVVLMVCAEGPWVGWMTSTDDNGEHPDGYDALWAHVALDLSDPTGQVHAAWWALKHADRRWSAHEFSAVDAAVHFYCALPDWQAALRDLCLRLAGATP